MKNLSAELVNMVFLNDKFRLKYEIVVTYWHLYSAKKVLKYNDVLEAHIGNKIHTSEGYEVENIEVNFKVFESRDMGKVSEMIELFESRLLSK